MASVDRTSHCHYMHYMFLSCEGTERMDRWAPAFQGLEGTHDAHCTCTNPRDEGRQKHISKGRFGDIALAVVTAAQYT